MEIKEPKIVFSNTKRALQQYAALYNEFHKDESKEQLKPAHFAQFYTYVRLLERNIAQDNMKAFNEKKYASMAIDTDAIPHLFTNNTELKKQLDGGVPSTFIRRYERLAKAGLVRKINHGPVKNYEIIINPYMLFIVDNSGAPGKNRPDLQLAQKWGEKWDSDNAKIAICKENIVSFQEPFNKIIIQDKESGKPSISSKDTQKDTQKDTTGNLSNLHSEEKTKDFGDAVLTAIKFQLETKKNGKKSAAEKMREKYGISAPKKEENPLKTHAERIKRREKELKTLRLQYATMMVQLMIEYLLPGIEIYAGERKRTISYVAENYFSQCQTYVSIQRTWSGYVQRLNDAKKFKETHPNYTPFPYYYFNKQNVTNGFEGLEWRKNKLKWEKQKRWQTNQQKLMAAIRRINKQQDKNTLQREMQYVKDNIPDLQKAFFKIIYTNHPDLMAKKQ